MKFLLLLASVYLVAGALTDGERWQTFKQNHGKTYRSSVEETLRYRIFQANLRTIEQHNLKFSNGEVTYKMGVNQFADLTTQEFVATLNLKQEGIPEGALEFNSEADVPDSVDWRAQGAVTSVKNQGSCGGCWAFAAAGSVEGALFLSNGTLVDLSPQNLLDCVTACDGCDGGYRDKALQYVHDYGILTEAEYPFIEEDEACKKQGGVKISGYVTVTAGDENALKTAVGSAGPISVGVDATSFQLYDSGVLGGEQCSNSIYNINHGVLAVGYGRDSDVNSDYWIIKNSWGEDWGEAGFVRLARNADNACAVAWKTYYPVI